MASGSYRYRVRRDKRNLHADKRAFLEKRSGDRLARPLLCQAMEAALNPAFLNPGEGEQPMANWDGFPWVTMVLGSGCLDLPETSDVVADLIADKVQARLLEGAPTHADVDGVDLPDRAARFTRSLVRDRIGLPQASRQRPPSTLGLKGDDPGVGEPAASEIGAWSKVNVDALTADMVALAALLTHFFHRTCSISGAAIGRWDDDLAVLKQDEKGDSAERLRKDVVAPALELLGKVADELQPTIDTNALHNAVRLLITEIAKNLEIVVGKKERTLRIEHVRLATEVSWYFLLRDTPVYPGWTDLLIRLMLEEGITEAPARSRPGNWNLVRLGDEVKKRLLPATTSSWEGDAEFGEAAVGRQDFYLSAADVLRAQAWAAADQEVRAHTRSIETIEGAATTGSDSIHLTEPPVQLPPASAFVTSFDIELEMALWKHSKLPFAVAVPVHVVAADDNSADKEAEFCWLLAEMRPQDNEEDQDLQSLLAPKSWRVLSRRSDPLLLRSQPVVVHLNGCPMLELPRIPQPGDAQADAGDVLLAGLRQVGIESTGRAFAHAVTVDEYLALRQAEAERFPGPGTETQLKQLPPSLIEDSDQNERFWMAMGVPIADSAIRHRIVAQINLRSAKSVTRVAADGPFDEHGMPMMEAVPQGDRAPSAVSGVSINKRIRDNEASLLYWVGLDVVRADCSEFAADLRHYAAHVREESPAKRPPAREDCTLVVPPPITIEPTAAQPKEVTE